MRKERSLPTALKFEPIKSDPPRKRWTRTQYESLSSATLMEEHLELVEGDLISKMGKKRPHVIGRSLMLQWLGQTFGFPFVNSEAPIDVAPEDNPFSEPEPDLIVLNRDQTEFLHSNPQPENLQLLIEVADSSVAFDLSTKARLYARAGIVDYWVLDLTGRRIVTHREPRNGQYSSVVAYLETELVSPLAAPGANLLVRSVLPPANVGA